MDNLNSLKADFSSINLPIHDVISLNGKTFSSITKPIHAKAIFSSINPPIHVILSLNKKNLGGTKPKWQK